MEKKIEDYLHLYLGCRCLYTDYKHREGIKGKLTQVSSNDLLNTATIEPRSDPEDWFITNDLSRVKPILRPLSSMTEEEMLECGNMVYDFSNDPDLNTWQPSDFEIGLAPEQFQWLLSKHFDLFGLIDAGLALSTTDKSK